MPRNTTMKHVLVIYEMVPEDTRIYALHVPASELDRLRRCHGSLSQTADNSSELEEDMDWLNQLLGQHDPVMTAAGACPPHDGGTYDAIILTGFQM